MEHSLHQLWPLGFESIGIAVGVEQLVLHSALLSLLLLFEEDTSLPTAESALQA